MKSKGIITAAVLSLCLLTGCGEQKAEIDPGLLYGTWELKDDGVLDTMTINSDGTYHKIVKMTGSFAQTVEEDDNWELDGDSFTLYFSDLGSAMSYTIAVDENYLVLDNGDVRNVYTKKQ